MSRRAASLLVLSMSAAQVVAGPVERQGTGVLVIAHGGDVRWNDHVKKAVEEVGRTMPAEVAFLMGVPDQRPDGAYAKLVSSGVRRVVIVPLFVSSWSDHYEQARFIGGLRADYPHAEHMKLTQLRGPAPVIAVTPGLDDHPILGAILADRAKALSRDPARETVVLVAHGPNDDGEAERWLAAMRRLGDQLRAATSVADVDVRLLRDDAPKEVKDRALGELRASVEERSRRGTALVVPLLMAPGKVADQIPRVLEGLDFRWEGATLLPDKRIAEWITATARAAGATQGVVHYQEQIVVTATRTERSVQEVPIPTEVVGRAVLEGAGARSVVEALAHCPGADVVPSLAGHSAQLQGVAGRSVLVLVDGEEVLGKIAGEVDLGNILVHDVERIEIVKGAGSALYGSDALGGVINVLTRSATRPLEASFEQRLHSGGGATTLGSAGRREGPWSAFVSGSRISRDAYDLEPAEPTTTGSEYRKLAVSGKVGYRLGVRSALTLSARRYDEDASDVSVSRGATYDDSVLDDRWQTIGELRAGLGSTGTLTTRAHISRYSHRFDRGSRIGVTSPSDLTRERLGELEVQYDQPVGGRHLLSVGGEIERLAMNSDRIGGGEREADTRVLFAQDELFLGGRFRLVAGMRYDHNSAFGSAWSPKLAAMATLGSRLRIRASWGEGFKAPEFKDMYIQFSNRAAGYQVVGNPDLRPEGSRSLSAGFEIDAWQGRLRTSASAFHNRIDDLIDSAFVGRDGGTGIMTYQARNIGAVRTRGGELDARVLPRGWLTLGAGYTYLEATDKTSGEPLALRPRHTVKMRATVASPRMGTNAAVFLRYVGRRPFADSNRDGRIDEWAPSILVLDARLAKDLGRYLQLALGIENALDEKDVRYFPVPGRRVTAGVVVRYERD